MKKNAKVLIIDGNWNLKRNFKRTIIYDTYGNNCSGTYGFLRSLISIINKVLPDKVIVMWDGIKSGKYRYDLYKDYKSNRKKDWDFDEKFYSEILKKIEIEENKEKYDYTIQKINTKKILDELFISQIEVPYIEADDLIAGYVIQNEFQNKNEEIIIFSRDKDFKQLISEKVSIITPDSIEPITYRNFKEKNGYIIDNELIFKCFEGDKSDCIDGIKGITKNTLIKFFPDIIDRKYSFNELYEKSLEMVLKKKYPVFYDKICSSKEVIYRNAKLMNLKKPFLNEVAEQELKKLFDFPLDKDRSIKRAIMTLTIDGYIDLLKKDNLNIGTFFSPFYILMDKEKKYAEMHN